MRMFELDISLLILVKHFVFGGLESVCRFTRILICRSFFFWRGEGGGGVVSLPGTRSALQRWLGCWEHPVLWP